MILPPKPLVPASRFQMPARQLSLLATLASRQAIDRSGRSPKGRAGSCLDRSSEAYIDVHGQGGVLELEPPAVVGIAPINFCSV